MFIQWLDHSDSIATPLACCFRFTGTSHGRAWEFAAENQRREEDPPLANADHITAGSAQLSSTVKEGHVCLLPHECSAPSLSHRGSCCKSIQVIVCKAQHLFHKPPASPPANPAIIHFAHFDMLHPAQRQTSHSLHVSSHWEGHS